MKSGLKYLSMLLCIGVMVTLQACQKDDANLQKPEKPLLEQAQSFFNNQVITGKLKDQLPSLSKSNIHSRQSLIKQALWEKAYIKKISTGEAVIVPLRYNKSVYTKVGKNNQSVTLDYLSYLMIYKSGNGMTAELVTWIPDDTYWEKRTSKNTSFSGKVIVANWQGKFIKGYSYNENGQIRAIEIKESVKKGNQTSIVSVECNTTDWYSCVSTNGGQTWHCEYDYSETTCYYSGTAGGGSGGSGGSSGGSTGGGGSTAPGDYPPDPGNPCAGSTSYINSGNSVSIVNPCYEELPLDIINNVTDPCLKTMVNNLSNNDVTGKIAEIISNLDGDKKVKINVIDADETASYKPANIVNQYYDPSSGTYSATIVLSRNALVPSTKENCTTVIIHEFIHAYFSYVGKSTTGIQTAEHENMAINYIQPMAEYLSYIYGISAKDATALAWSGLSDAKSYIDTNNFQYPGGYMTKDELKSIYVNYVVNYSGTPTCN